MTKQGSSIKVIAIDWCKSFMNSIGGLRLVLSNGQKSPTFFAKNQKENYMQRCDLQFPVKRINGTANNIYYIR